MIEIKMVEFRWVESPDLRDAPLDGPEPVTGWLVASYCGEDIGAVESRAMGDADEAIAETLAQVWALIVSPPAMLGAAQAAERP